jgi:hypothetical protein
MEKHLEKADLHTNFAIEKTTQTVLFKEKIK